MRLEQTQENYKVWLSADEIDEFISFARYRSELHRKNKLKHHITVLLGLRCGLRASEIADLKVGDKVRDENGYWLDVTGKDTTGKYDEGKTRRVYLPDSVERVLYTHERIEELNDTDTYLGVGTTRIRHIVDEVADYAADQTGNEDYKKVSSHDLRRNYAQHLLVRENVPVRIVMEQGGWSSYSAIEPYLTAPTEENQVQELKQVF